VILTREAAEKALPSLLGMAVDYRRGGRARCAAQDRAAQPTRTCPGSGWWCAGILRADFPEVAGAIQAHSPEAMGMSYELADARVEDMRAEVWKLTRVTFTGAAILLREKAAYRATSFRMAS